MSDRAERERIRTVPDDDPDGAKRPVRLHRVPPVVDQTVQRVGRQSGFIQGLYVALGFVAITAPLAVASFTEVLDLNWIRALSFVGGLAAALVGGFRLARKGNAMRRDFVRLMCLRFEYEYVGTMTLQQLADRFSMLAVRSVDIEGPDYTEREDHTDPKPDVER